MNDGEPLMMCSVTMSALPPGPTATSGLSARFDAGTSWKVNDPTAPRPVTAADIALMAGELSKLLKTSQTAPSPAATETDSSGPGELGIGRAVNEAPPSVLNESRSWGLNGTA